MCKKPIKKTIHFDLPAEFMGPATADYIEGECYTVTLLGIGRIGAERMSPENAYKAQEYIQNSEYGRALCILNPVFSHL
jgi:hypothetical protein